MLQVYGRSPKISSARQPCAPSEVFPAIFTVFRRLLLWGSARGCLLASSLSCHAAFISASTPGPAHQPYTLRGRLERGINSAAVERMTSAMSVEMSLIHVPSGIGGSAKDPFNDWGGRGCNIFFPVLGGNGTKTDPIEDIIDQPPGQMR